jgi:hypothetical protein
MLEASASKTTACLLINFSLLSPECLQSQEVWHKAVPILAGMVYGY